MSMLSFSRGSAGALARVFSLALAVVAIGCADGSPGEQGLVRFSLVYDYAEGSGFERPAAASSTILIALRKIGGSDDFAGAMPHLTLAVETLEGSDASVFPMGIAQFGIYFPSAGRYRIIAQEDGEPLDWIQIDAAEPDALTFRDAAAIVRDGECVNTRNVSLANDPAINTNETLWLSVIPRREGRALIGLLSMTVNVSEGGVVDAPLNLPGTGVHEISLAPRVSTAAEELTVSVEDPASGLTLEKAFRLTGKAAPVECAL